MSTTPEKSQSLEIETPKKEKTVSKPKKPKIAQEAQVLDGKFTVELTVVNGQVQIPSWAVDVEIGVYDDQQETDDSGFTPMGVALVSFALPRPDGGLQPIGWEQLRFAVRGSEVKLSSPFFTSQGANKQTTFYTQADVGFRPQLVRTIARALKEENYVTVSELYAKVNSSRATTYHDTKQTRKGLSLG